MRRLVCTFVFANTEERFSCANAHLSLHIKKILIAWASNNGSDNHFVRALVVSIHKVTKLGKDQTKKMTSSPPCYLCARVKRVFYAYAISINISLVFIFL